MRLADMHIHTTFSPDGKSSILSNYFENFINIGNKFEFHDFACHKKVELPRSHFFIDSFKPRT